MTHSSTLVALENHHEFVQRLARTLVRDSTAAEDLAQDTWLTYLQQPPRAAAAIRSWLGHVMRNRAHNQRRQDVRRIRREAAVARSEALASTEAPAEPQERLELQQRVVTAVLSLAEPQRKALLLHFYDGMTMAAIAVRLGVPAGTVRSWISRAIGELRQKLDAHDERGRAGWLPALATFVDSSRRAAQRFWLWSGALGVGGAVTATVLALGGTTPPALLPSVATGIVAQSAADEPAVRTAARTEPRATAPTSARIDGTPVAVQEPEFATMPIAELMQAGAWIQHLLRKRMLVADPNEVGNELAALGKTADFGATRILRREWAEFASGNALGIPGGGGYWSFVTKSHSYHDEPDLCLEGGHYGSTSTSAHRSFLLALGDVPLARLSPSALATLGQENEAYALLWRPAFAKSKVDPAWLEAADRLRLYIPPAAAANRTYLLRRVGDNTRDALFAFRTVSTDQRGHTLVYRQLQQFEPGDVPPSTMPGAPAGTAPAWLGGHDEQQLISLLDKLRAAAEPRLVAVPESVREAHRQLLVDAKFGLCRILPRGRFNTIVKSREGAAYFDFIEQTHHYDAGVHLELQQGAFSSGFAGGDRGYVVDLGVWPLLQADMPPNGDESLRRAMQFVRDLRVVRGEDGSMTVDQKDVSRAAELGVDRPARAVAGHTYLLRAVNSDHSITVAFQVLALDDDGATLLWRILARDGR